MAGSILNSKGHILRVGKYPTRRINLQGSNRDGLLGNSFHEQVWGDGPGGPTRPPHNLNGDNRWTHIIPNDTCIDFKFMARVVRLNDEPPEIDDLDSDVQSMQTVSMDTRFFRRIT